MRLIQSASITSCWVAKAGACEERRLASAPLGAYGRAASCNDFRPEATRQDLEVSTARQGSFSPRLQEARAPSSLKQGDLS
jgi:hypothetical protein